LQESILYLIKLNNKIFRYTQSYLDRMLKEYNLSSGSYQYLLILRQNEGISQSEISKELGCDKAMSAKTITKLIKLGYLYRIKDEVDARAFKVYLTKKAKARIPEILKKINKLAGLIMDLNEEDKILIIASFDRLNQCNPLISRFYLDV